MQTIVFIEANKSGSSREAIKAAERLGFFTVLLTKKQHFIDQRIEFPDVHQMILVELFVYDKLKENIIKLQKQGKQIKCILSFVDPFVHEASALSEEFCSSGISAGPILKMENKVLTRELLKDLSSSPHYAIYTPDDSLENFIHKQKSYLPLIVKSPVSAGSRDVLLANDKKQLKLAIQKLLNNNNQILVEEYLTGPQYLIEVLVRNGKVHIIAIIEQEITFTQRFIVTGYGLLAEIDQSLYDKILEAVSSILKAFQMNNGACHLEMRLVQGSWKLVEINPRIAGGAMNRIIEVGYGINLVEETIQLMLGNKPNLTKKHSKYVYAHYLTVDATGKLIEVTGKNRSSQYPGVEEVYIKPRKGTILGPPLSMGDRCGYILASSDVKEEAKRIAKEAASEVRFILDPIQKYGEINHDYYSKNLIPFNSMW
ncbi:ATP-grasp domain-containing protein [Neobacillus massiliamazoniensis]|uniref:ATP-grasp domain protein n=1 Tax=Neobacillus massiliamazoniensis TaxID=1499688 RepID=A0A0U1NSU4_9BACI|nr:ATP-grasp domain-containing protein [Neobacillus massiliamazoniensis]CRK81106.1 ATP-grasp domain protein [Neobacillus massiliamazoniensis]